MQKVKSLFLFTACLLAIALVLPFTAALAQTDVYQLEAGAFYNLEKDENDGKFQAYGLRAAFYFSPISLTTLPWAEAAFLAKASNVSLQGMRVSLEEESGGDTTEGNGYRFEGAVELYVPNIPLFISAEVSRMSIDIDFGSIDAETTSTELIGKVGFLPMNGLLIGVLFGQETSKIEIPDMPAFNEEDTTTSYGGFLKVVMPVGTGMAIGLELEAKQITTEPEEGDETTDTNIAGKVFLFPIAQLGIGVTFETQSGDDLGDEGNTYGVEAIFFPMPNIGINASFSRFMPKNDVDEDGDEVIENDTINVGVLVRI